MALLPLQIRLTDRPARLTASAVPYGVSVQSDLEFAFIVEVDGEMSVMTPYEFACYSAACRPPTSGGTGGSNPGPGGMDFKESKQSDLDLLFPGRRESGRKKVYGDGTFSVEGLNEDGSFKEFDAKTEKALQDTWDSIGPSKEQYVANMVVAGQLAMGINPTTGKVNAKQAAIGHQDSKWYTVAHNDVKDISEATGIDIDAVTAATAALSAGRLW